MYFIIGALITFVMKIKSSFFALLLLELVPPTPGILCYDNTNGTELTTECVLGEVSL